MIVSERVDQHPSFSDLITKIDPAAQFFGAISHSFIPGYGLLLNRLAITQPAYVCPVGRNRIELQFSGVGGTGRRSDLAWHQGRPSFLETP
jgi:hypothetical protein